MRLRMSDGELTLSYKDGSQCHTHFRRNTIISFKCNRNAANDGKGWPRYVKAEECTYLFEWETKYACENHPTQGFCRVDYKHKRFDLSALVRENGGNWVALDGENQNNNDRFYINVCKDVLSTPDTKGCSSTSVCRIDSTGNVKNLGEYTQVPTYDLQSQTIQINYTDGDSCGSGGKTSSRITFICKPGDLESGPVLIQQSDDECMYEFEWHTAAACVLSRKTGTNCKVFDNDGGYSFDLSRLTKPTGQFYNVTTSSHNYDFLLNVCGPVTGTQCDNGHTNTAVCQIPHDNSPPHKTGSVNTELIYFDGMINLTYSDGDPYNNPNKTPRQTEIAFLCDPHAGIGSPEFVAEANYTYSFKWYTAYACPTRPVECVYVDKANNKQYDLSRLSKPEDGDNWVVLNPNNNHKFYINVCRPVNPVHLPTGGTCGWSAAVCETEAVSGKETIVHGSLGEASSGPVLDGIHPGQLLLRYTGGDTCVDENGKTTTMTTLIHFDCLKGSVSQGPISMVKSSKCEYSTIWRTEAACPIDDVETTVTDCSIKDTNSDFIFNLKPLMKKSGGYYTVNTSDDTRTFRLNICGNVSSCDRLQPDNVPASVCETQTGSRNPALAMYSGNLEFSDDGQLTLTYGGKRLSSGQLIQVKIAFICKRDIGVEKPIFIRQEDQTYYFKFETALACAPEPVECVAIDNHGNKFDLNALAKTTSNWMVADKRTGHSDLKYYINVCRPMNPVQGSNCPGGPVGGCQVGVRSFSLGYVQSQPFVGEDGSVILQYRGGTLCHKGTDKESHRSTRINFICSHVESDPVLLGETDTCEYLFEWSTPSACPQHRIIGSGCKVTDPVYNYQFDLSPLRKQTGDYEVTVNEYKYLLNVCGELVAGTGACAGGTGVGACQTKPGDNSFLVNTGKANGNVMYDEGELTLKYTDGKGNCHQKYNRTTIITFVCNHAKDGRDGPRYLKEDGDCTYQFEWQTSYACPPYTVSDCMVTGTDGAMYDLASLARSDDNYVDNEEYQGKKFILNVCQTLVHKKGQTCPPNSAACMIDMAETKPEKRYHKIGELSNSPVKIEDGALILRYDNGEKCSVGNKTVSTVVIMNCDQAARDTEPGGHFMVNMCEHHFIWTTRAACPVGSQGKTTQSGNCTAVNPQTGYVFDLNVFNKPSGYTFKDELTHHNFIINVCAPLADSPCGKNVGSCQMETAGEQRHFSSGIANSDLQYRGGFLMLNYSSGAPCHQKKYQRGTIINFICKQGVGDGTPTLIQETDECVYQFNWYTSRVCEKEILCSTEVPGANGSYTVDLSPLIKSSGHYAAVSMLAGKVNPGTTYYINICSPLNPIRGKTCPPGSSACMIEDNKKPVSLGRLAKRPYVDSLTGKVTLLYVNGSSCDQDPSKNRTTRIIFTCQVGASNGEPKFEAVTLDCEYIFMWYTYLACQDNQQVDYTPACRYTNPRTDQKYDLSSLNSPVKVSSRGEGEFRIQPCGKMSGTGECAGAAICLNQSGKLKSYGATKTGTFMMESREILKLQFTGGSKCIDSLGREVNAKTELMFQCDNTAGVGQPVHWPSSQCTATFLWKTNLVCPAVVEQCSLMNKNTLYDFEILSRETESWNHTDSKGNIYFINICQGVHGRARGEGCHIDAAVCRKTPNKIVDNLGSVSSQKLYMHDDGKTIILEYTQGEAACSHGLRRSNNPVARTVIKFICDKMVGGPRLIEKPENEEKCLFEFEWKTRIACQDASLTQVVKDNNGIVVDPISKGAIDLKKLYSSHVNHAAYEKSDRDRIWYAISIDGELQLDKSHSASRSCLGAAVCQQKQDDMNYYRNLGTFESRQYYFSDDQLEVVYTSPEKCKDTNHHKRSKNVTTTIIFNCDRHKNKSEPMFSFKSRDCSFLFNWDTDVVCLSPDVQVQQASGTVNSPVSNSEGSSVKPKTVAVIISVFMSVIVLCIVVIVFHKPERRAAFASKMKRIVFCKGQTERHINYSMLSQDDEDPEIDEDFFMDRANDNDVTTLPNTSTDTRIQTTAQVRSYHDSSDEDMLE